MILVTGTARLVDGGRDAMIEATEAMVAATREEEGCHDIRYSFDVSDPQLMVFHEAYTDEDALQAHMGSAHLKAFYEAGGGLMQGRPDVTMWAGAEQASMGG